MRRYIDLVLAEIEASRRLNTAPLQTIFFGGGEQAGTTHAYACGRRAQFPR